MTEYYYGNKISDYGLKNGYVDYACLAKCFDAVYATTLMEVSEPEDWQLENGGDIYYEDVNGNIYYSWSEMDDARTELENEIEILQNSIPEEPNCDYDEKEYQDWEVVVKETEDKIEQLENEISYLEDEHFVEYYQYYIISDNGANLLMSETHETVWYNEKLDLYMWGVAHYGTSWDYVLTEIKIK